MIHSISLIPDAGIQFLDRPFNLGTAAKLRRGFWEYEQPPVQSGQQSHVYLMCLDYDAERNTFINRASDSPAVDPRPPGQSRTAGRPVEPLYEITGAKAVEVYLNQWIPLPIFNQSSSLTAPGPANWARGYLSALERPDEEGNTHILVLAFDTAMETRPDADTYGALSPEDEAGGAEFLLAAHENQCSRFLGADWVAAWLEDLFRAYVESVAKNKGRKLREEDFLYSLEHLARYITLLEVLGQLAVVPPVRLVKASSHDPVDVDLILDVGNSRTCGMLVETRPGETTSLNDSYVLKLRDLSDPVRCYSLPFESRIEFSMPAFGDPKGFSKGSGRRGEGFSWPSVQRVGPEAGRLAVFSRSAEGRTGMSSPKRYLWDEFSRPTQWRFNTGCNDPDIREQPVLIGEYLCHINDEGTPLRRVRDRSIARHPAFAQQLEEAVMTPRFSRSSMMMFMLGEILLQALTTMNAPANRARLARSDVPRRLRRMILTMPPAMPLAERKIFLRWARWAVETTWQALGWARDDDAEPAFTFQTPPTVHSDVDEASAAQVVYIYNEVVERFRGDVAALFGSSGHPEGDSHALRLATIDVGGGTMDLIVSNYQMVGQGAAAVIRPTQEFREGFNLAGDDLLREVAEKHFFHPLKQHLHALGLPDAHGLFNELFGGDFGGQSERARSLRGQFAAQVAAPIGLHILSLYERYDPLHAAESHTVRFNECFTPSTYPHPDVFNYLEQAVRRQRGPNCEKWKDFSLGPFEFEVELARVDDSVRTLLGPALHALCEVIQLFDCDFVLLTGRPSRLPALRALVLQNAGLPPHRVINMHQYRIGSWYPFRDTHNRVSDPKTTAAVGALLCTLSEGQLDWFRFQSHLLRPRSTARYLGEMELSGQIRSEKLFFPALDLDDREALELEHTFEFHAPILIGYRQLAADRWTCTPFYRIDFASPAAAQNSRGRTPYHVTLAFTRVADDDEDRASSAIGDFRDEGAFAIIEPVEARDGAPVRRGELQLRLQTLKDERGYWLDTGTLF